MIGDYREFTQVVDYELGPGRESEFDVLEGKCQRCGDVVYMERGAWEEHTYCYQCVGLEAEDALDL